jgi:hypothetical protein
MLVCSFLEFPDFFGWPTISTNDETQKLSSKHVFGGKRARRAEIFLEKSKFQQIPGNMFRAKFQVFPLVVIFRQPKKSKNWRKCHASANLIPESPEILIFSRKILALRALSPTETCLELSF